MTGEALAAGRFGDTFMRGTSLHPPHTDWDAATAAHTPVRYLLDFAPVEISRRHCRHRRDRHLVGRRRTFWALTGNCDE